MSYGFTNRQAACLRFIAGFVLANDGVSPCIREIQIGLGLRSKSYAHRLVTSLEERGAIRKLPHRAQAIEVLRRVTIPQAPDGAPLFAVSQGWRVGVLTRDGRDVQRLVFSRERV